ncbi:MAG TPA: DUF2254 domain-containing protein [Acidimicrobiales bacterium]|nr:DUF2254 domain-containing protein [Acidimicrobiales bacterium]
MTRWLPRPSARRRDALRTNLWLVPTLEVAAAVVLFVVTYTIDQAAYRGDITLPNWVNNGSADAARQILTAIAAAVITVMGLVFSITIVALTLASTQFGPRMLRNFIRDRGTQVTLGTFVATFVYAVLVLGSIAHGPKGDFVPHLSITVALALVLVSLAVLIYFIHHMAKSIQLPEVIASIANDLAGAIDAEAISADGTRSVGRERGPSVAELERRMDESGAMIPAPRSGYLQFVAYDVLVDIACEADAVVRFLFRPGHFVIQGLPLATVWPADAANEVAHELEHAHFTGPHRTLSQDLTFAIDQLVEIAIRALSPAVNDTFTALTCIDWLSDGLCKITARWDPELIHRDAEGRVRIIAAEIRYERLVERSFDKIRQASRGMPAVMIRQIDALTKIAAYASTPRQRAALRAQAQMILRASDESVPEPQDRLDVSRRFELFEAVIASASGERAFGSVERPAGTAT